MDEHVIYGPKFKFLAECWTEWLSHKLALGIAGINCKMSLTESPAKRNNVDDREVFSYWLKSAHNDLDSHENKRLMLFKKLISSIIK